MIEFRIVTINTGKGDNDFSLRLPWLARSLRALNPDILLLQESLSTTDRRTPYFNTATYLSDALRFETSEAPARLKQRLVDHVWRESTSGLATLSRFPIDQSVSLALPSDPADGERIAQLTRITIGKHHLQIANLHLTHLRGPEADALRRRQLETILDSVRASSNVGSMLISGDFNTVESAMPSLLENHDGFELQDVWIEDSGPRATVPVGTPSDDPRSRCVDYLLTASRAGEVHPKVIRSAVVLGEPSAEGHFPSDHRGIMATFHFDESVSN